MTHSLYFKSSKPTQRPYFIENLPPALIYVHVHLNMGQLDRSNLSGINLSFMVYISDAVLLGAYDIWYRWVHMV